MATWWNHHQRDWILIRQGGVKAVFIKLVARCGSWLLKWFDDTKPWFIHLIQSQGCVNLVCLRVGRKLKNSVIWCHNILAVAGWFDWLQIFTFNAVLSATKKCNEFFSEIFNPTRSIIHWKSFLVSIYLDHRVNMFQKNFFLISRFEVSRWVEKGTLGKKAFFKRRLLTQKLFSTQAFWYRSFLTS